MSQLQESEINEDSEDEISYSRPDIPITRNSGDARDRRNEWIIDMIVEQNATSREPPKKKRRKSAPKFSRLQDQMKPNQLERIKWDPFIVDIPPIIQISEQPQPIHSYEIVQQESETKPLAIKQKTEPANYFHAVKGYFERKHFGTVLYHDYMSSEDDAGWDTDESDDSLMIITSDDDLCRNALKIDYLLIIICQYLSIEQISFIVMYLNKYAVIAQSSLLIRSIILGLYEEIQEIKKQPDLYLQKISSQVLNKCVNGVTLPFRYPYPSKLCCVPLSKVIRNCNGVSFNDGFGDGIRATSYDDLTMQQTNYSDYIFFQTKSCSLLNVIFADHPIRHYLNLFLPFAPIAIPNTFIHTIQDCDLIDYIEGINTTSRELDAIFLKLWRSMKKGNKNIISDIKIVQDSKLWDGLNNNFSFHIWMKFIDWTYFIVAGGSIFSILTNAINDVNDADIDIFSVGCCNEKFFDLILHFQIMLRKEKIAHQMNQMNAFVITFVLFSNGENPVSLARIQFIWTCETATIAQILSSFDLAASQVALRPTKWHPLRLKPEAEIYLTDSFLYLLDTGKCIVYNASMKRIEKYEKKGINYFLISGCGWAKLKREKWIESHAKPRTRSIKIQINDETPFFLAKLPYYDEEHKGHCYFKNRNVDLEKLFDIFMSYLLNK